jgi:hypothetical protein
MGERIRVIDTVDADYQLPGQPGHGLVFASTRFTTDCKAGEEPSVDLVYFSNWYSNTTFGQLPVTGPADKRDFQDPPGYLIVREARASGHEFRYIDIGSRSREMKTRTPFTVEEGKAVYLGEIHVIYVNCNARPSMTIQVKDEWERDRRLFEKQMTNVRSEDVIKRVLPANWR